MEYGHRWGKQGTRRKRPGFVWEISQQFYDLYGAKGYEFRAIKFEIVRFLFYATKDMPKGARELPPHVVKARALLDKLTARDRATVRQALRTVRRTGSTGRN